MNKTILIALAILLSFCKISAQQNINFTDLPKPVQHFFPIVYPLDDNIKVDWYQQDTLFVANFTIKGFMTQVFFKETGFWEGTLWTIDCLQLPKAITNYISNNYSSFECTECKLTNNAFDERGYIVKIKNDREKITLKFNLRGEIANTVNIDKTMKN